MGVVDLARDQGGNQVALKRLTLHGSAAEVLRSRHRLLREAEVLRRLHHPNVVRLLDVVEEGDDIVLVMPYLSGGNLADRVAQHGPAPPDEIDRLAQRLLGGLVEAHTAGIIHRDVKPGNVLYDEHAEPYLADFGLAHSWDQTHGLTVAGMVVGTPGFMPPEQARDEPLTPASDIFALGATLLYAATGVGPFGTGDPGLLMVRAAGGKVERLPKTLPKPLRRRLAAMLDPRPERRPTASALLAGYSTGRHVGLPPGGRRAGVWLAGVGVAAAVAVGAFAVIGGGDDNGRKEVPPADTGPKGSGGPDTGPKGDGDDGASAGGRPSLVDRLDATVDPAQPADAFLLPFPAGGSAGTGCPRQVAVRLALKGEASQPLRVQVGANDTVLGEALAWPQAPAEVRFDPGPACTTGAELMVLVQPTNPLLQPIRYTLQRDDTPA
jgi:hypothetical protein